MAGKANTSPNESPFNQLLDQLDLPVRSIAAILNVRIDTVLHWRAGRRDVPYGVLDELQEWLNSNA